MSSPLRVIFMGTAEIACPPLAALIADKTIQIHTVVSQPDRASGRHLKLHSPPVKELALQHAISVLQPERARNPEFIQQLRVLVPDLIVVMAYGQILPADILELPRHGCINIHTSLLPKYRGASPIQSAILNGETETGVTIMKMDVGMDTGPILSKRATPIQSQDNAQTLHDRLAQLGAELLLETIPGYVAGTIQSQPQPSEGVSHAGKIKKEDGHLDWLQPATLLWNRVRAFTPWPGAFTHIENGGARKLLKIWSAEPLDQTDPSSAGEILKADASGVVIVCGRSALRVLELQIEGGRRMNADQFLRGHPLAVGQRLG